MRDHAWATLAMLKEALAPTQLHVAGDFRALEQDGRHFVVNDKTGDQYVCRCAAHAVNKAKKLHRESLPTFEVTHVSLVGGIATAAEAKELIAAPRDGHPHVLSSQTSAREVTT